MERSMRDYIFFAGKSSADNNIYITDAGAYVSPQRKYDKVSVPGRSGDLLFESDRFDNVEQRYPAILVDDFDTNYAAWKSFLLARKGYFRLSDTFHPDEFYLASFNRIEPVRTSIYKKGGTFNMIFDRKPQKYLVIGERVRTFTSFPAVVINPTEFEAYPLIRVYGSGTLTIGSVSITINTSATYVDIDCELQEALQAAENKNITTTKGKFPYLESGKNTITFTGSKLETTPRFYTI